MTETRAPSRAAWEAMRALHAGARADFELLSAVSGRRVATIRRIAAAERWTSDTSGSAGRDHGRRIAAVAERLIGEVEAIEREGHASGYDKARIDAVSALTRALEKLGEFTQSGHPAQEAAKRTDAEMADTLARIDARIVELATEYARELVGAEPDAGARAPGGG